MVFSLSAGDGSWGSGAGIDDDATGDNAAGDKTSAFAVNDDNDAVGAASGCPSFCFSS